MLFKKKRFAPLLTLILCSLLAVFIPLSVTAAGPTAVTNFTTNFGGKDYFSNAEYTYTDSCTGSASVDSSGSNTISITAQATKGCSGTTPTTTTVTLTAAESISFQYTLTGGVTLTAASEKYTDEEGNTYAKVVKGDIVSFALYSENSNKQESGSVTISNVQKTVSKVPEGCASYSNGGEIFSYLDEAISFAETSNDKVIVVTKNGAVYHSSVEEKDSNNGEYTKSFTIPSGVTLLIPCDAANTVYTEQPGDDGNNSYATTSVYRKLTLGKGTSITVNGSISIGGKAGTHMVTSDSPDPPYTNGAPSGPLGYIDMADGSSIIVEDKGNLYAWGFITGSGSVIVRSGGTVYEDLQIRDYRGGGGTSGMNKNDKRVFPFSQYYIQNIEVPLTLKSGATEKVCMTVSVGGILGFGDSVQKSTAVYIGSNSGLIRLSDGDITKTYDGSKDRIIYDLNGDISFANLNVSIRVEGVSAMSINSTDYVMNITNNMTLNANGDSNITVNQDLALLPGAVVNIGKDATVTMGEDNKLFVYAKESWSAQYVGIKNVLISPVYFAPGLQYTRTSANIVDAEIVLEGTLDATKGHVYTTGGGANIHSTGSGTLITSAPDGTTVTYQVTQSGSSISGYPEIAVTPAKLLNGDGKSYVATGDSAPNTFTYDSIVGAWRCEIHTGVDTDHNCDVCGAVTECVDTNDHNCDVCGKEGITECKDENDDAVCDICQKVLCEHATVTPMEAVDPTCEGNGTKAYWTCSDCKNSYADEACTALIANLDAWKADTTENGGCIPATGHAYAVTENGYTWAEDYSKVTASGVCANDETHTATVDSAKVESATTAATCSAPGATVYTATFAENKEWTNLETQIVSVELGIDSSAHKDAEGDKDHKCDYCGEPVGSCSYESVVTNPTCTEKGYTTYTCSECGNTYTGAEAEALGHTEVTDAAVAPTCTATGLTEGKHCSECGTVSIEQQVEPMLGHDYNKVVTDPTCTEDGYTTYTCKREGCDYHEVKDIVSALTHNWVDGYCDRCETYCDHSFENGICTNCGYGCAHENVTSEETEPTCTVDGTISKVCDDCGHSWTEAGKTAPGHEWVEADCETAKHCSACDAVEGSALGHAYNDVVVAPTCTENGYTTHTCTREGCEHSYQDEPVAATGHTAGEVKEENRQDATCTTNGSYDKVTYCATCGNECAKETISISSTGHTHVPVVTAPTCTEDGYTTYTCHCGDSYVDNYVEATGHLDTTVINGKDATCGEAGYTGDTYCNDCQQIVKNGEEISATGNHSYESEVTTEPGCETEGVKTYTCTACGNSYTEAIEATGHNMVAGEVVEPTCTADGYTVYTCTNGCGATENKDVVSAKGHTPGEAKKENEVASTWEKVGSYDLVVRCTECSEVMSSEPYAALLNPFYDQNMDLQNRLTIQINLKDLTLDPAEMSSNGYYAVVTRTDADGKTYETTIPMSEWERRSNNRFRFAFSDLEAKQMADKLEIVLYNSANEQISVVFETSVMYLAMDQIARAEEAGGMDEYLTLMVDMLNYGAAAQTYFHYNEGNPANRYLTEKQQMYATTELTYGERFDNSGFVAYQNTNVNLESNIVMNMVFYKDAFGTDLSKVVAKIRYSHHFAGNTVLEETIYGSDFERWSTQSSTGRERCCIAIDWLHVPDGYQVVTIEFFDLEGNRLGTVSNSLTAELGYWVESFPDEAFYPAIIKFMNSAYAYFH